MANPNMTTRIIQRRRISCNPALELLIPLTYPGRETNGSGMRMVYLTRLELACGNSLPGNEAAGARLGLVAYLMLRWLRGTDAGGDVPRLRSRGWGLCWHCVDAGEVVLV